MEKIEFCVDWTVHLKWDILINTVFSILITTALLQNNVS